jgi:hypothetical protein
LPALDAIPPRWLDIGWQKLNGADAITADGSEQIERIG